MLGDALARLGINDYVAAIPSPKLVIPWVALVAIFATIAAMEPNVLSYPGSSLLFGLAMPFVFASMAQMCVIVVNDIDLGIGPFISLTSCIAATSLASDPLLGAIMLLAAVAAYGLMGGLIHVRRLPSIVVTLGASFVWLGFALLLRPSPGGSAPAWSMAFVNFSSPFFPMPIVLLVVVGVAGHFLLMRTAWGTVLRGIGGNQQAVGQAGWSLGFARVFLYVVAGVCGVIAGILLDAINTSGDATVGAQYTLTSIAAVIIGGGEFVGGDVTPIGTVVGTLIMLLIGSLLSVIDISTNWQASFEGGILIIVLGFRALSRSGAGIAR